MLNEVSLFNKADLEYVETIASALGRATDSINKVNLRKEDIS
jgi:hypothetical protein